MPNGGKRPGAGRKPKIDEDKVRNLAVSAIVATYGSEQKGFNALLTSGDAVLKKWVFEHAFGKPKEQMDVNHKGGVSIVFKKADAS